MKCRKCSRKAVFNGLCSQHYINYFESKVKGTIKRFKLLSKGEKIIVAASGGKDSTAILHILKKFGYNPEALTIDTNIGKYAEENLRNLKQFCKSEKIPLHIYSFKNEFGYSTFYIRDILASKGIKLNLCTICGVLRRQLVNKKARELKADKLVTGHNLDDEAQAVMMNILRGNIPLLARQGPKTGIKEHEAFVQRVKPLYLCPEKEIEAYSRLMKFPVVYEKCPYRSTSYRLSTLTELNRLSSDVKINIINNFLKMLPHLRKRYSNAGISHCKICHEPSSRQICKACSIRAMLPRPRRSLKS